MTLNAFLIATLLGIFIPIISSILPIKNALGQNLHDAVDSRRSKSKAVEVRITRSEDQGLSLPLLLIGIFLTTFGFAIYYVIPLSLLAEQLALLLNMFFCIINHDVTWFCYVIFKFSTNFRKPCCVLLVFGGIVMLFVLLC